MKAIAVVSSSLFGACLLLSATTQADERAAKTYDIKNVLEVVAGGGCGMEITQGDTETLRVEATKEVLDRVSVDQTGDKLSLRVKAKSSGPLSFFSWFGGDHDKVNYILQLKDLHRLELNGACNAHIGDWSSKALKVHASGASEVTFANLKLEDFFIELSGASNSHLQSMTIDKAEFQMSGAANADVKSASSSKYLKVEASGASNFHGKPLVVEQADLGASGASNIELAVTNFLKADASGASNIYYLGQPKVQSDASGASHVNSIK